MIDLMVQQLQKLDEGYFHDEFLNDAKIKSHKQFCYYLTTYCHDFGIEFNKESWNLIKRIRKIFGDEVMWNIIEKLCKRNHDT